MDYFKLFEMEEKYDIDLQLLNTSYLNKQAIYHPDRAKTNDEKNEYQVISTNLNKAYSILKDDFKRAEYILSLRNIHINDPAIRDKISGNKLSEIWQEREKIEDMDATAELYEFSKQKLQEQQNLIKRLTKAFKENNLQDALDITISFKYLVNLIENIKLKLKNANNRD